MPTVAYHTLGCKVNQYETDKIRQALERAGFETVGFGSKSDACVINTCTVTSVADAKSRAAVRRALRASPDAFVVVTGCLAQLEPAQLAAIEGVGLIVSNEQKRLIPERLIARLHAARTPHSVYRIPHSTRTRAPVKVQDGCDHFCAYCVVPYARPRKVSRPLSDVIAELHALAESGYKEIVLTGIRLGSYGDETCHLPDLIRAAAEIDGIERIRLSSVEPWEINDALLDAMASPKVCRHLHIPLQSGDDGVLARMDRPYTAAEFAALAQRIRERIHGVGITTDVMAGFPGETEAAFANTCRMVEKIAFSRVHVFRYSPRKRTAAASMPDQVDAATKRRRAEKLIEIGRGAMRRFAESFFGQTLEVLVERRESFNGSLIGYADNYIEVAFAGGAGLVGELVPVVIEGTGADGTASAEVCNPQSPICNARGV